MSQAKTQQLQPKIEFGKCPLCAQVILEKDKNNNPVRLEGYSEFWILLSDCSRMKVAICKNCKKSLTKKNASEILAAHREYWEKGIIEDMNRKIQELEQKKLQDVNYYNNLTLVKHGLREKDLEL